MYFYSSFFIILCKSYKRVIPPKTNNISIQFIGFLPTFVIVNSFSIKSLTEDKHCLRQEVDTLKSELTAEKVTVASVTFGALWFTKTG